MNYTPKAVILENPEEKRGKKIRSLVQKEIEANDKVKNEEWLEDLIFENPDLLAVEELAKSFTPMIPIGRQIPLETPGGSTVYIDCLYISPRGKLTIVETKLWKNPEQHRTVVAQIIEYAEKISKWNYNKLEEEVKKSLRNFKGEEIESLEKYVSLYLKEKEDKAFNFQKERFLGNVNSNLENGEFLLLIAGDKISPNVALLADAIHKKPGLGFNLYLIELQLYNINKEEGSPLLVISHVVGKTVEETRAIVKIKYDREKDELTTEVTTHEETTPDKKEFIECLEENVGESLVEFFNKIIKDMKNLGCIEQTLKSSCVINLLDSKSNQEFALFGISENGTVFPRSLTAHLYNAGISEKIGSDFSEKIPEILNKDDQWKTITLNDIQEHYDDFYPIVSSTIDQIKNATPDPKPPKDKFLGKVPDEFKGKYTEWFKIWENKQNITIKWSMTAFSLQAKFQNKYKMVLIIFPSEDLIKLIKSKDLATFGATEKTYQQYVEKIKDIPGVQKILNSETSAYIKHTYLRTADNLDVILKATTDFAEEVMDKN